ncbi:aspartyl protease family protein 2 [Selaginella moellendorffii]|nr:aspartyl protease family protein 2 [Selaginella moellendorffii]|eukprot:XP_002979394.2 aspartyl protease family protein 2 [Selaginella moellendorffii]
MWRRALEPLLPLLLLLLLNLLAVSSSFSQPDFVTLQIAKPPVVAVEEQEEAAAAASAAKAPLDELSFSVPLLHRDAPSSPLRPSNATTKQLLLARLRKDELRSKAIAATIALATNGWRKSDLRHPLPGQSESLAVAALASGRGGRGHGGARGGFASPLISGIAGGSGDYFARIGVGTPARSVYMVADTGSDVSWLQCSPCRKCYRQQDPIFNPSLSSSFKPLACASSICGKLKIKGCSRKNKCMYQVSYGDGSFTVGDFSTETLSFGEHAVRSVAMGCGRNNQGLFHGAAGLLGLGRGPLSFPSQTGTSYASVFSYCLPRRESAIAASLVFGPSAVPEKARFTKLLPNRRLDTYYYVGLARIRVAGSPVNIPPDAFAMGSRGTGGVIVDSGTAISRLTTPAYTALRDAFRSLVTFPSAPGISLFDTCYDLSSMKTATLPAVVLDFDGGASMPLPADGILVNVDDEGTYCLAFAPEEEAFSIIGNVQQQTFRISIDNQKEQMGIAPDQCTS